jgi:hypothetical protein
MTGLGIEILQDWGLNYGLWRLLLLQNNLSYGLWVLQLEIRQILLVWVLSSKALIMKQPGVSVSLAPLNLSRIVTVLALRGRLRIRLRFVGAPRVLGVFSSRLLVVFVQVALSAIKRLVWGPLRNEAVTSKARWLRLLHGIEQQVRLI